MPKVSHQLPLTERLHVPPRSPLSWCMRQPGGPITPPMSAAATNTRIVASRRHKIGLEFPVIVVFDEAQPVPVPDAPSDQVSRSVRSHLSILSPIEESLFLTDRNVAESAAVMAEER